MIAREAGQIDEHPIRRIPAHCGHRHLPVRRVQIDFRLIPRIEQALPPVAVLAVRQVKPKGSIHQIDAHHVGPRTDPYRKLHDIAGLSGMAWQSLYHLAMGMPVEDTRLTTEPGYEWEDSNAEC